MPTASGARATDLAWAAGLMVGDGSVYCNTGTNYPILQINMCDQRTVCRFAELFGARMHRKSQPNGWRTQYRVYACGPNAVRALAKMWPYMEDTDKARQAVRAVRTPKHFDLMLSEVSANPVHSRATDMAWAAGLVVSEGCVDAQPRLRITVAMNDKRAVYRFAKLFEARVYRMLVKRDGCVPISYRAGLYGFRAIAALAEMWPYMECSDKADQAIAAARKAGVYDKLMEEIASESQRVRGGDHRQSRAGH